MKPIPTNPTPEPTPPTQPRTPLQTLRAIFPWWYLLVFAPWAYIGFYYLLVPENTIFSGVTGSFMLTMFAFATIAILAIGFTGNYIRLKRGRPLPPPRFYFLPRPFLLLIALPVALLIYFTITTTTPTYSQPSSWQDQLNLANQEAARVDKDAALTMVHAEEPCCRDAAVTPDSTLEIKFDYMRPSGSVIRITLYDTNPPRLKEVDPNTGEYAEHGPTAEERQKLADYYSASQISPRQVLRATLANSSSPPLLQKNSYVSITRYSDNLAGSANWYLDYFAQPDTNNPGHISTITGEPLRFVVVLVDPTNGHIVEIRDDED